MPDETVKCYDHHPEPWDQLMRPTLPTSEYDELLATGGSNAAQVKIVISPSSNTLDDKAPSRAQSDAGVPAMKKSASFLKSCQRQLYWRGAGDGFDEIPGAKQWSRYRQSRLSSRRVRRRVVFKHGDCNITYAHVAKRKRKFLLDIFTTLVDVQWRWTLVVFALNFLLSWLAFAVIWWAISAAHGDLLPEHLPGANNSETWTPCITNVNSFTSCFLFSVETQHTIGFGSRLTTEECPEAIFVMCLQSITGVFIDAFMVGIVFAKLSRPKKRTQTLLFSRNAVICHRDGQPCLLFRVGDMRKSHIIEAHVRAQIIRHKVTREGEQLPFFQQELKIGFDGLEDRIFFIWPTTVVHQIDKTSPLYRLSAMDLLQERFEIVVILEGIIESTGMTTQARSSYLPSEILWGHRFVPVVKFKRDLGEYEVDFELFNNTVEVDTPLCSAKQLDEHRAAHNYHLIGENDYDIITPGLHDFRSPSSDTLDLSCYDAHSLDERIVITPPSSKNSLELDGPITIKFKDYEVNRDDSEKGGAENETLKLPITVTVTPDDG